MPRARWNFHRRIVWVPRYPGSACKREEILRAEGNCIGSYTKSIRRDLYNGQDSLLIIHNPIQLIKLPIAFIYILPYS